MTVLGQKKALTYPDRHTQAMRDTLTLELFLSSPACAETGRTRQVNSGCLTHQRNEVKLPIQLNPAITYHRTHLREITETTL